VKLEGDSEEAVVDSETEFVGEEKEPGCVEMGSGHACFGLDMVSGTVLCGEVVVSLKCGGCKLGVK
jgi:hypothetical protein